MSMNASRHVGGPSASADPFLFSKQDIAAHLDLDSLCSGQWSSSSSSSHSSSFFPESPEQYCPSSAPVSPQPSVNLELWSSQTSIKQEGDYYHHYHHHHKEELLIDCLEDLNSYIINIDSHSQGTSPIYDFPSVTLETSAEEIDFDTCYKDFLQLVNSQPLPPPTPTIKQEEAFPLPSPTVTNRRPRRKAHKMESDETASTSPSESSLTKKPRTAKQPPAHKKKLTKNTKVALPKKSPEQYSNGYSDHLANGHAADTSRRASPSLTMSTSTSASDSESMSLGGTRKTTRSLKDRSPEAYSRRREKNNIAVRKSREKKRQEIKKFADEHMKLKREVEQMRTQNEKLRVLVSEVEEGILDKSKTELAAMIQKVKKQMDW
ncbi:hypothetical protein RvY_08314 [Ramazzottius varieornatus]|uniref:BZIP domain-containing protein n=1 Tax=Ramazzottius varieornatus TaxID=947166 RepID=A0A1D1V7R4_RAMVA|nr:hypothetical protein RvY_08314 [Ramazzottius varieornatus]